ncbi:MAG: ComF family protein [Eubacteriales bacterium]|nr:ComF family protein [Eubacteriales bacterium]
MNEKKCKLTDRLYGYMKKAVQIAKDAFFPPACPVCGQALPYIQGVRCQVCEQCKSTLSYIKDPRCLKCGKEISKADIEYCYDCSKRKHLYKQGTAVYSYTDALQKSIYRFKYQNKREYAAFYAKEIEKNCGALIRRWNVDAIIPVPLHSSKYRRRGYNQSALIAKELGALLNLKADEKLLVRSKKTIPMKELNNRQRIKNLENAFICTCDSVKYKKVIIVDDIYTTGATIDACTDVLLKAGVCEVFYVCLCIGKGF